MNEIDVVSYILEHLDATDLLKYQRISHTWQTLIQSDPQVQKRLYFAPDRTAADDTVIHPLLEKVFHFLTTKPSEAYGYDANFAPRWIPWSETPEQPSRERDAITRAEASWRRMFTHQPPIIKFEVECLMNCQGDDILSTGSVEFSGTPADEGLRMGELYDNAVAVFERDEWSILTVLTGKLELPNGGSGPAADSGMSNKAGFYLRLRVEGMQTCEPTNGDDLRRYDNAVAAAKSKAHKDPRLRMRVEHLGEHADLSLFD